MWHSDYTVIITGKLTRKYLSCYASGGFTTFSTFSSETSALLASGRWAAAAAYVLLSVVLGVSAVFLGQYVVR